MTDLELPTSPAGRRLAWVLEMVRGGHATLSLGEVSEQMAGEFLAAVPADRHAAGLAQVASALGPFRVARLQTVSGFELLAQLVGDRGVVIAKCAVEPFPPHRIIGLGFRPEGAGPPGVRWPALPAVSPPEEPVGRYLAGARSDRRLVAIAAGMAPAGQTVALGFADGHYRDVATPTTSFALGSVAKTVTTVAVLRLATAGALRLDDVRPLLTHTVTGEWRYGNEGFIRLAGLVAEASGESYRDHVIRTIFDPLGMVNTDVVVSTRTGEPATGYEPEFDELVVVPIPEGAPLGAGALVSTAADMAKYVRGLAELLDWPEVLRPHAVTPEGSAQGLGFLVEEVGGRTVAWHHGRTPGFRASLWVVPEGGTGVVAMTNTATPGFDAVGRRLLEQMLAG